MKKKGKWVRIGIILSVVFVIVFVLSLYAEGVLQFKKSLRPKYCDKNGCIDEAIVFRELPPFPGDFYEVDIMVENNKYPIVENFSKETPDENYYKQPEFYPTWEDQGVPLYTPLKPGYSPGYVGVVGYGAYPGDLIVKSVKPGQSFLAITYWHSAWAIAKYQGMSLVVTYPEKGQTGMGEFKVEQNPEKVKEYFNVSITPNTLLLYPNYPLFGKDWAQKVRIEIHVNEKTPPGKYLIGISAVNPPADLEAEWIRDYKLKYTSVGTVGIGRPTYQIFVEVQ